MAVLVHVQKIAEAEGTVRYSYSADASSAVEGIIVFDKATHSASLDGESSRSAPAACRAVLKKFSQTGSWPDTAVWAS